MGLFSKYNYQTTEQDDTGSTTVTVAGQDILKDTSSDIHDLDIDIEGDTTNLNNGLAAAKVMDTTIKSTQIATDNGANVTQEHINALNNCLTLTLNLIGGKEVAANTLIACESKTSLTEMYTVSLEGFTDIVSGIYDRIIKILESVYSKIKLIIPKAMGYMQKIIGKAESLKKKTNALKSNSTVNAIVSATSQELLKKLGLFILLHNSNTIPANSTGLGSFLVSKLKELNTANELTNINTAISAIITQVASASVAELKALTPQRMYNTINGSIVKIKTDTDIIEKATAAGIFKELDDGVSSANLIISRVNNTNVDVIALTPKTVGAAMENINWFQSIFTTENTKEELEKKIDVLKESIASHKEELTKNPNDEDAKKKLASDEDNLKLTEEALAKLTGTPTPVVDENPPGNVEDGTSGADMYDAKKYTLAFASEKASGYTIPGLVKSDILIVLNAVIANQNNLSKYFETANETINNIIKKLGDIKKMATTDIDGNTIDGLTDKVQFVTKLAGLLGTNYIYSIMMQKFNFQSLAVDVCSASYEGLASAPKETKPATPASV